jgi:hypothetical protein
MLDLDKYEVHHVREARPKPDNGTPAEPERTPVERITAIVEKLFEYEPVLTRDLLVELRAAGPATLVELFGEGK